MASDQTSNYSNSSSSTSEVSSPEDSTAEKEWLKIINLRDGAPIQCFTRIMLNRILPSDSEFTEFVMNFFPNTARKFAIGLNRIDKHNILIADENAEEILAKLRKDFKYKYIEAERTQILRQTAANIFIALNSSDLQIWTLKLKAEFGTLNWETVNKIVDELRSALNSTNIKISKIDYGCVALEIISSNEEYLRAKTQLRGKSIGVLRVEKIYPTIRKRGQLKNLFIRKAELNKEKEEALINAYLITQGAYNSYNHDELAKLSEQNQYLKNSLSFYQDRPLYYKILYNVVVLGDSASGKTSLIKKLTDPSFASMSIPYPVTPTLGDYHADRTMVVNFDTVHRNYVKYCLRFHEYGGRILSSLPLDGMLDNAFEVYKKQEDFDAQGVKIHPGVQALILVVDLGIDRFDIDRINDQVKQYFDRNNLNSILRNNSIRNVILFINKSDLLSKEYIDMQIHAKDLFGDLIVKLNRIRAINDFGNVKIIIGSVYTDMGLMQLYSYLVETSVETVPMPKEQL